MNYCGRIFICGVVGVALNTGAIVDVSGMKGDRYEDIASHNVFGLRPPEKSDVEPLAPVVSPKIRLAGITTLLGRKIACLILPATKPGSMSECLLLCEGESQEEIEMKEIRQKTITVINHGEEQTLDFDEVQPRNFVVENSSQTHPVATNKTSLTPEQQTLLIEAQRMKAMQDGDPVAKILPPTGFTSEITNGTP